MCGIIGYIGARPARPVLVSALKRLEYRGYDSCGLAISGSSLTVFKDAVNIDKLAEGLPRIEGTIGIGHTRWATHGSPSRVNAHPHVDCAGRIAVAHNGIITNAPLLKRQLNSEGHRFLSQTDTEVIPHLIEKHYRGSLEDAVAAAIDELEGSYAIAVLMAGKAELVAARKDSPLIIGLGEGEKFIASDVPAVLDYTRRIVYLEDGDLAVVTASSLRVMREGVVITPTEHRVSWGVEQAEKAPYEHFMLKEIHEQPRVIRDVIAEYERSAPSFITKDTGQENTESLLLTACGTSYHAALIGQRLIEELRGIPARAELASELNYSRRSLSNTTAVAISQSGETADILKAMKRLKRAGCRVLAITNVLGSSASRLADQTLYTRAGPEISVAATKSFTAQLVVLYWLAMAILPGSEGDERMAGMWRQLEALPGRVQYMLEHVEGIMECARYLAGYKAVFFIGRGLNTPVALEGALKLKEVSYIHAEGSPAGELKHGAFALLGRRTPVVAIVARDNTYEAMLTSIKEVKARGSPVIALAEEGDEAIGGLADRVITVPFVDAIFSPLVNVVALQLLAYYTARERGCPIDTPRNLAKSVTVE